MNEPRFIVLCGIDGCGKSSIMDNLSHELPDVCLTHWSQLCRTEHTDMPIWFRLRSDSARILQALSPIQRALFISAIIWSEYELLIKPCLEKGKLVISDSYCYKALAKEKIYKKADPILYQLLSALPRPNHIVLVDTEPRIACERKKIISPYETNGSSFEDHVYFQELVRSELLNLINQSNHVIINGNNSVDAVFNDFFVQFRLLYNLSSNLIGDNVHRTQQRVVSYGFRGDRVY